MWYAAAQIGMRLEGSQSHILGRSPDIPGLKNGGSSGTRETRLRGEQGRVSSSSQQSGPFHNHKLKDNGKTIRQTTDDDTTSISNELGCIVRV